MRDTLGIIFAEDEGARMGELTQVRSLAALPVAGRYRLIDFILSNMVNSGIANVGVATKYNYRSLMDHLGDGSPWDLNRKRYGLFILPPFYKQDENLASGSVETLRRIMYYIRRSGQKHVLLADGNVVCNLSFDGMMERHLSTNADITVAYADVSSVEPYDSTKDYLTVDSSGRITSIEKGSDYRRQPEKALGFYLIDRGLLESLVETASVRGEKDIIGDVFAKQTEKLKIVGWKYDGYAKSIDDIADYYDFGMQLLSEGVRESLFESGLPVYTKVKDKVPARYLKNSCVRNSMVADGCIIDGCVENCILFRGVEIRKGCEVRNSIIMQDGRVMENCRLNHVIFDKQVFVNRDKTLSGDGNYPFVVGKNRRI